MNERSDHASNPEAGCAEDPYLSRYVPPAVIRQYADAGVTNPALLVTLHRSGCTPTVLAEYTRLGANAEDAATFVRHGWCPAYLSSTAIRPTVAASYLRCGINDPHQIRCFHRLAVTPELVNKLCGHSDIYTITASVMPLPEKSITAAGNHGPVHFLFHGGELEVAEDDRASLEVEWIEWVLGGRCSEAVRLYELFSQGLDSDWIAVGQALGVEVDFETLVRRWLRSIIDRLDDPRSELRAS
jgi:hypothetical protein